MIILSKQKKKKKVNNSKNHDELVNLPKKLFTFLIRKSLFQMYLNKTLYIIE